MPARFDSLNDAAAEHDQGDPRAADDLETARVQSVNGVFHIGRDDMVGIPAPVVPGQDEDRIVPTARLHDRVHALPREVVALRDVLWILAVKWRVLVIPSGTPHEAEIWKTAGLCQGGKAVRSRIA